MTDIRRIGRGALAWAAAGALMVPVAAGAEDASVSRRLDERGIKYELDKDADYKIVYNYKTEGRTQLVFVAGRTQTVGGFIVRKVFSPAAVVTANNINGARALQLLSDSDTNKLGSWEIGGGVLYLVIKLPDSVNGSELQSAMNIAAELADDMEIKLTGKDDY